MTIDSARSARPSTRSNARRNRGRLATQSPAKNARLNILRSVEPSSRRPATPSSSARMCQNAGKNSRKNAIQSRSRCTTSSHSIRSGRGLLKKRVWMTRVTWRLLEVEEEAINSRPRCCWRPGCIGHCWRCNWCSLRPEAWLCRWAGCFQGNLLEEEPEVGGWRRICFV